MFCRNCHLMHTCTTYSTYSRHARSGLCTPLYVSAKFGVFDKVIDWPRRILFLLFLLGYPGVPNCWRVVLGPTGSQPLGSPTRSESQQSRPKEWPLHSSNDGNHSNCLEHITLAGSVFSKNIEGMTLPMNQRILVFLFNFGKWGLGDAE